jgi:hypothetical protein
MVPLAQARVGRAWRRWSRADLLEAVEALSFFRGSSMSRNTVNRFRESPGESVMRIVRFSSFSNASLTADLVVL